MTVITNIVYYITYLLIVTASYTWFVVWHPGKTLKIWQVIVLAYGTSFAIAISGEFAASGVEYLVRG